MSADGSVELFWGDGETRFRLTIKHLLALEEKLDCGAIEILDRFHARRWRLGEAKEILRLGLMGGGASMEAANRLISKYFDEMGIAPLEHGTFAHVVLASGLSGPKMDDDTGELKAATSETGANASTPPRSMAQAPEWAGLRAKLTSARSSSSGPQSTAGTKARKAKSRSNP